MFLTDTESVGTERRKASRPCPPAIIDALDAQRKRNATTRPVVGDAAYTGTATPPRGKGSCREEPEAGPGARGSVLPLPAQQETTAADKRAGRHLQAVEASITAAVDALTGKHLALCELVRTLAEQMEASGPEGPGTRLAGAYLTAVRTLNAAASTDAPAQPVTPKNGRAALRAVRDGTGQ